MIAPLACVIPALDAAETLASVVRATREALPLAHIIVVDDGSADDTPRVARAVADEVIAFPRNRGKGAALRAGFAAALGRGAAAVVTLDADGQHAPASAPALLAALDTADLALGARVRRGSAMPLGRRVTNSLASSAVTMLAGVTLPDSQSGFRAIRGRVLEAVRARGDRYDFETDFLLHAARLGFRICSVPVSTRYGAPSHFRPVRDSARVVRAILRGWRGVAR